MATVREELAKHLTQSQMSSFFIDNMNIIDVKSYGATGDGVTDDSTAISDAVAALPTNGGILFFPPGSYLVSSTILLTGLRRTVWGYGAEILTTGAIYALTIRNAGNTVYPTVIEGININQRGNSTALGGILIEAAWNTRLRDVTVVADGSSGSYVAGIVIQNTDNTDSATGSFWTRIENIWIRKFTGTDTGMIPVGILLRDNANATVITGGGLNNCTEGIKFAESTGGVMGLNSAVVNGVAFEACTDGIIIDGEGTDGGGGSGIRIIACRAENMTNFFVVKNRPTHDFAAPPVLFGNYLISNVTNHISNANDRRVLQLDASVTPNISPSYYRGLSVSSLGAEHALDLTVDAGTNRGLNFNTPTTPNLFRVLAQSISGTEVVDVGSAIGGIPRTHLVGARSISGTATRANNLRGQITITDASTSASVALNPAESDTTYFVTATPVASAGTPAAGSNRVTTITKATTSITVNVEAAPGAGNSATFDWHLIR